MKLILSLIFFICLTNSINSQVSKGGIPFSFSNPINKKINEIRLTPPYENLIKHLENSNKTSFCVGTKIKTILNPSNSGTWINHTDGSKSWLLKITIDDAIGLSLNYKKFYIPDGAEIFLYNENKNHLIGKYTSSRNEINPITHTQIIEGSATIIEYHEPANCNQSFGFEIESVGYYFRGFEDYLAPFIKTKNYIRAESCQIDVACSEGDNWSNQIDAVVHFTFEEGDWIYVCSGSTINNTNQDCKPYILTAWHCGEHTANQNLNNYTWYWNYQKSSCQPNNNGDDPFKGNQTMINGLVISSSGSGTLNNPPSIPNQLSGSDFTLVKLTSNIPDSYNAFYSGWDNTNSPATSGVSIHHPNGSAKKISTFNSNLQNTSYNGGAANAHWAVNWIETENGHGVTEPGSSGSPIFNQEGRIVGQLSGGSSFCDSTNYPDLYGKFSTNWKNNGDSSIAQLAPWLNPSDSTLSYIDGIYFSCNASADFTTAGIGSSINFFGSASSNIESWNWNFDVNENVGVSPVNSDLQNPSNIIFDSSGIYLVSLLVTNNFGKTCTSSLEINVINTTDVKPILENEIKVFPNPNNGRFKIEFKDYTAHRQGFYIYNQLGKIIKSFKHIEGNSFYFENFNPGIYYVKSQNSHTVNKIIIF